MRVIQHARHDDQNKIKRHAERPGKRRAGQAETGDQKPDQADVDRQLRKVKLGGEVGPAYTLQKAIRNVSKCVDQDPAGQNLEGQSALVCEFCPKPERQKRPGKEGQQQCRRTYDQDQKLESADERLPDPLRIAAPGGCAEGREQCTDKAARKNGQLIRNTERRRVKAHGSYGKDRTDQELVNIKQDGANRAGNGDPAAKPEQGAHETKIEAYAAQGWIEPHGKYNHYCG